MMTTNRRPTAGTAASSSYVPAHYLRRVARTIVLRAALNGRLSWHVALPILSRIAGQEVQP